MLFVDPEWVMVLVTAAVVGIVVVYHYEVIQLLSRWCGRRQRNFPGEVRSRPILLCVMFVLIFAHVIEIWAFGAAFWWLLNHDGFGEIAGYPSVGLLDSVYFSAATYTTVGWGDLAATGHIRFLAGTEALVGFMMITWSASFGYLVMERTLGRDDQG
ncbi:ion channel [Billgrantia antri]|nr:ion channel [Halomonas antri]